MKLLVILLIVFSVVAFSFNFSLGVFEYGSGVRGVASFHNEVNIGKFDLGIRHWIFFRAYDFGFYDFPNRITPFKWESSGGWWDVYVRFNINKDVYLQFLHRSEHNFDGCRYLNIHWYNFFELGFKF